MLRPLQLTPEKLQLWHCLRFCAIRCRISVGNAGTLTAGTWTLTSGTCTLTSGTWTSTAGTCTLISGTRTFVSGTRTWVWGTRTTGEGTCTTGVGTRTFTFGIGGNDGIGDAPRYTMMRSTFGTAGSAATGGCGIANTCRHGAATDGATAAIASDSVATIAIAMAAGPSASVVATLRPAPNNRSMRSEMCLRVAKTPGAGIGCRGHADVSAIFVKHIAYGRTVPVNERTQSSQATSRSRSSCCETKSAAGFQASNARAIRWKPFVQSSPRRRWASSCKLI